MINKTFLNVLGVLGASALLVPLMAEAQDIGGMACCQTRPVAQATPAKSAPIKPGKDGVQKATVIIDGGYSPESLSVTAGKPVEITFVRKSKAGCDGDVVFSSLNIKKSLKPGETAVVKFTPKKSGTIAYTCGMGMYKGQIVAI